ncbi:unnamed protein product [marine sediment metagenome]|uniref:Uncharacterized protein n=1 Tax=marine sediment metagenome TaxID=412755 RepID=X0S941_9ZZZZ
MTTLNKYRIWCSTESIYVESWAEAEPSVCPNNSEHTIDADKTVIVQTVEEADVNITNVATDDGKMLVNSTSRPLYHQTVFTSYGDSQDNSGEVWGGQRFEIVHTVGDEMEQSVYIDLNTIENSTFIHEGYMTCDGPCKGDMATLYAVPKVTAYTTGIDTNYSLYGGYLVIPAAGNGVVDIDDEDRVLIEMPISVDTGERGPGMWDADYDPVTHTFSNIAPNMSSEGRYNMFVVEVIMREFAHRNILTGADTQILQASDSSRLGHGIRLKFIGETNGADHDWSVSCKLTMHRLNTVRS